MHRHALPLLLGVLDAVFSPLRGTAGPMRKPLTRRAKLGRRSGSPVPTLRQGGVSTFMVNDWFLSDRVTARRIRSGRAGNGQDSARLRLPLPRRPKGRLASTHIGIANHEGVDVEPRSRVSKQFAPALEVEGSLAFRGTELDRQRHSQRKFILLSRERQAQGPGDAITSAYPDNSSKKSPGLDRPPRKCRLISFT